ncbi:hypothetical protein VPH35_040730 [Triticum aestivum]
MDGGDERGRRGGAQGPGRALPLELRAQVHPQDRQGQSKCPRWRLTEHEAASGVCCSGGGEAASGEGRGGAEDRHVPRLLGSQLLDVYSLFLVYPHCIRGFLHFTIHVYVLAFGPQ